MNKNDPVDVLIIGAGASGAAVAWSLAETKMHILCLDQGGWRIDYDALTPFVEETARRMGVWGLSGAPMSPLTRPPMPPQPLGLSGPLIGKAMNKLGWHWWPSDTTVATMDYEGRARCINLGHCTPACAQGAKSSTDITYWPHAIRAGVEVKTHCRVREILTNADR